MCLHLSYDKMINLNAMKKILFLASALLALSFSACNDSKDEEFMELFTRVDYGEDFTSSICFDLEAPADRYRYPVLPGCAEWLDLHNLGMDAVLIALQVPSAEIEKMTCEGLLQTYLDYPYIGDITLGSYTEYKTFLSCLGCDNEKRLFKQMKKQGNMADCLLKYYKAFNCNTRCLNYSYVWRVLNYFCSLDEFNKDLSSSQKKELVRVAFEKMELFEKTTGWECNTAPLFLMARTMMNDGYKPFVNKVKSDENLYIFVKDGWDDINLYQTRVIGFAKEYCGLSK